MSGPCERSVRRQAEGSGHRKGAQGAVQDDPQAPGPRHVPRVVDDSRDDSDNDLDDV